MHTGLRDRFVCDHKHGDNNADCVSCPVRALAEWHRSNNATLQYT